MKTFIILFLISFNSLFAQSSFSLKPYNEYNELFPVYKIENLNNIQLSKDSVTYIYNIRKNEKINIGKINFIISNTYRDSLKRILTLDSNLEISCYASIHNWNESTNILSEDRFTYETKLFNLNNGEILFNNDISLNNKQLCVTLIVSDYNENKNYKTSKERKKFEVFVYLRFVEQD